MGIKSNASAGELDSPFYSDNKAFCETFESFMTELGGETIGAYNAWSYNVKGRVDKRYRWIFQLNKSTYSSGTLLLSTKKQSLQFWTIWKCKCLVTNLPNFQLRKKRRLDAINIFFSNPLTNFVYLAVI